jgi:hypothetical protein
MNNGRALKISEIHHGLEIAANTPASPIAFVFRTMRVRKS